jgi:hypothetical protein
MSDEIYGKVGKVPVFESVCFRKSEANRYAFMERDEIFPFFELRSAAQDLRRGGTFDAGVCRRQVLAQFAALRDVGAQGVVLSAFGCGAFENPPNEVANVYKSCIEDPSVVGEDLKIIMFAIIPNPNGRPDANFQTFKSILQTSHASAAASSSHASPKASSASSPETATSNPEPGLYMELSGSWIPLNGDQRVAYQDAHDNVQGHNWYDEKPNAMGRGTRRSYHFIFRDCNALIRIKGKYRAILHVPEPQHGIRLPANDRHAGTTFARGKKEKGTRRKSS